MGAGAVLGAAIISPRTAHALTLAPAKIEVSGNPGQTLTPQFFISNGQEPAATFYTSAEDFEANGESGTPYFVKENGDLSSWITVAPSFTVQKGQTLTATFQIHIPKGATPGDHFAAVFLGTAPPGAAQGQVSVSARLGILVFLHVSGPVKEGGGVVGSGLAVPTRFYSSLPISFFYLYQNTGGDRVVPTGTITVRNILGWKTASLLVDPGTPQQRIAGEHAPH